LSKTIPIWAAVVNTAVCLFREEHGLLQLPGEFLHLPKWIPEHECYQIERKIDIWASELLDSNVDISCIARRMKFPLRCVWRSQNDTVDALPFGRDYTPLVLISASLHEARHRRMLEIKDNDIVKQIMYDYVPGAGDDEESWSKGLKPVQFWKFYKQLLLSGKDGIDSVLQKLLKQQCTLGRNKLYLNKDLDNHEPICWLGCTGVGLLHVQHIPMISRGSEEVDVAEYGIVNLCREDIADVYSLHMSKTVGCRDAIGGGMTSKDCECFILDHDTSTSIKSDYLWLPLHAEMEKLGVVIRAPAVIEFASMALDDSKKVIFVYEDAASSSLSAALALSVLIACFDVVDVCDVQKESMRWQRCATYSLDRQSVRPACGSLSRTEFKKYVANSVAMYCPSIILRKHVLKQVFNCFVSRSHSTSPKIS